jgi:YbbR domain-containing protein
MEATSRNSGVSVKQNRRLKVFLACLLLTSFIWLLVELSKTYSSSAEFKLEYRNLPDTKMFQAEPPQTVAVGLRAPGFNILKYKLKNHRIRLDISNLNQINGRYFLLPNSQLSEINAQLSGSNEVTAVLKDTIFVDLGNRLFKKVPVRTAIALEFNLGFGLTEGLKVTPDSIVVSGPERQVDSIQEVHTAYQLLENINQHIALELEISTEELSELVSLSEQSVTVEGKVDKFTEGSFEIPVTLINVPPDLSVNPFPKEIFRSNPQSS